ncbi:MAG: coproporphyrinogen III oxidase, partial [Myxococcaceae bacterium]
EERLAMGLRLSTGVDIEKVCAQFGESFEARRAKVDQFVRDGFAEWSEGRLRLTPRGMNVHSEIAARLI